MAVYTEIIKDLIIDKVKNINTDRLKLYAIINNKEYTGVDISSKYMRQGRCDIFYRAVELIAHKNNVSLLNTKSFDFRFEEFKD